LAAKYQKAESHFEQALNLHHKVEAYRGTLRGATSRAAAGKLADKETPEGLYAVMVNLGHLYGSMCKNDDELQVYQEALQEVCGDIAHENTPKLEMQLSRILTVMGQVYISLYNSPITNGAMRDKGKCTVAKALLEEALSIQRALSQDGMAEVILIILASAHGCLQMFDEAHSTLKQALDFTRRCHGKESKKVASCHQRMDYIRPEQVKTILKQLSMHMECMLTNLIRLYHSPGSRVLVEGFAETAAGGARQRRALSRRRRAPTGSDQSHEDMFLRGSVMGSFFRGCVIRLRSYLEYKIR